MRTDFYVAAERNNYAHYYDQNKHRCKRDTSGYLKHS